MASAKASVKAREERHAQSGDQIVLGMLDVVDRNPAITQRSVASELGIALGLANSYLKRCVRKGLIKVSEAPTRRYAYYLTPQGFAEKSRLTAAYLRHSFSLFHQARLQFGELFAAAAARGQRRFVLLGAGDLADIASLVAVEHPVEIAATLPAGADAEALIREVAAFGPVDAVVVTAMIDAREIFEAAVVAFGPECVHAPELLRLRPRPRHAAEAEAQVEAQVEAKEGGAQ